MRRNISRPEESHDRKVRDDSVVKHDRRGKRRRPRSMGRYPFMTAANDYLEAMTGVLAPSTWKERERRLRRMNKDLLELEATKLLIGHLDRLSASDNDGVAPRLSRKQHYPVARFGP